jgi:hypothetical protein
MGKAIPNQLLANQIPQNASKTACQARKSANPCKLSKIRLAF